MGVSIILVKMPHLNLRLFILTDQLIELITSYCIGPSLEGFPNLNEDIDDCVNQLAAKTKELLDEATLQQAYE